MALSSEDGANESRAVPGQREIGRRVDVLAVVGACVPERQELAERLARSRGRVLLPARRLRAEPEVLEEAVSLLARMPAQTGLVIEHPLETPTMELIGSLSDPAMPTRLSAVICVVDVMHLLQDLDAEEFIELHDGSRHAGRADLMVQQIEYASEIVLVNTGSVSLQQLLRLEALLSALSPRADIRHGQVSSDLTLGEYSQEQTRAGWVSVLNDDFHPVVTSSGVDVLRYEQLRPFHPGRLYSALETFLFGSGAGEVVRSAGFCRLATRPHVTAQWDHVGSGIAMEPLAYDHQLGDEDEVLSFGQEIAIVGLGLDRQSLTAALDGAALNDDELAAGPMVWSTLPDPFPQWRIVPNI